MPRPVTVDWIGAPTNCVIVELFIEEMMSCGVDMVCAFTKNVLTVDTVSVLATWTFPRRLMLVCVVALIVRFEPVSVVIEPAGR